MSFQDSINWGNLNAGDHPMICGDIATIDYLTLSRDSLERKYDIDGFFNRLIFWRSMKIMDQGAQSYSKVLLGNLLWVTLLTIPLIAIMMKLLYVRRRHYWVEHLIFWVHVHCFMFCVTAASLLLRIWTDTSVVNGIGIAINFIFLWIAMKRYYGQGFFKTSFKFILAGYTYWFIWWFLFVWNLLVTVFIF